MYLGDLQEKDEDDLRCFQAFFGHDKTLPKTNRSPGPAS